jgi:hypothetical protein
VLAEFSESQNQSLTPEADVRKNVQWTLQRISAGKAVAR